MKRKVRFGIVGCGYFGSGLAHTLHGMERAEVAAVFGGRGAQPLAEQLGCRQAESLEALMRMEDVDAVIVASPSYAHRDPVVLAAQYGKHVFCEKPVALSLRHCEDMLAACREANVLMMAGHIYYFLNGVRQVRQWIADGIIGRPIVVHSERTGWEFKQAEVSWKKNNETSGGHLFHHIHELDLLQTIMGQAQAVCTAGGNLAHNEEGYGNEDDVLLVMMQFDGGAVGSMQYGSGFRWGEHYVKINGTEGAILIDFKKSKVLLNKDGRMTEHLLHENEEEDRERAAFNEGGNGGIAYGKGTVAKHMGFIQTMMRREMEAFRDAVLGLPVPAMIRPLFDGTAARSSVATAEAALVALKERRWVPVV